MSFLENFKNKNITFISDSDLDGFGSSILAFYYIKPICNHISFFNTGDRDFKILDFDLFKKSEITIFTDIAPPNLEFYNKIKENYNNRIFIIDHHNTHREVLGELPDYYYDSSICATRILFNYLTKDQRVNRVVSEFVSIVDCFDMWHDNSLLWDTANELNLLKSAMIDWRSETDFYRNRQFIDSMLFKFDNLKQFNFTYREVRLISSEKAKQNKYYQEAKKNIQTRIDNEGNKYAYVEAVSKLSVISNKLLKEFSDYKYVVARSTFKEAIATNSISLRSVGDFNVRRIAEKWGGGGHLNSAGISMREKSEYNSVISGNLHLI